MAGKTRHIGSIIAGSLLGGLQAKLDEDINVEGISVGRLIVVDGALNKFFCLLKDVSLEATNEDILLNPPRDDFSKMVHAGVNTFYKLSLQPMLITSQEPEADDRPRPSTTVPPHFSPVCEATADDISLIFGEPGLTNPEIGSPVFMDVPVCLNLERFCKRSNAVFGKSGSGKSVLARMILGHLVKSDMAINLIFDMHGEYGWSATSEGSGLDDPSLRQLLGSKVAIFTVDADSPLYRKIRPDYDVQIPYGIIEIADLELAAGELGLTQAGIETMYRLHDAWGESKWLAKFLAMDAGELSLVVEELKVNDQALGKLHRCLSGLKRLPFIKKEVADDTVARIMNEIKTGRHIVFQFGRYNSMLSYILVANILTRRLHRLYVDRTDSARAEGTEGPKPLVVTIEEAHKFLDPAVARQTIFGTIAREMRKYNMVLLLIDQRPSGIDDEILSQVGTRIIGELGDERDINAVLTGLPSQGTLKVLINNLEPRQFLLTGFAPPMPVVIDAKEYGTFCSELRVGAGVIVNEIERRKSMDSLKANVFGDDEIRFD
ncbi:MAG: ATP-binding protein [Candidatus Aquicultor sp.]|nr:ATP-binding protein [Candidatus Aquicultor sp.]